MSLVHESPPLSPTVARIVAAIRERIQSGRYQEGEWLPTERDLAEDFQVSRILIRAAVKELEKQNLLLCHAHRRPMVRSLLPARSRTVAARRSLALWLWPTSTWPPSGMIVQGIQEGLGNEFRLVLGSPSPNWTEAYAAEAEFLRQIHADRDIEGLILGYTGGDTNRPQLEALRAANIPLVFMDHLAPAGFEADYVGVNNKQGTEQAVNHLISLGHRHIAYVSNYDALSTVSERLAGYRRALTNARLEFRPELVHRDPGPSGSDPEEGCATLIARLLELPVPPTAIVTVNDVVAFRVLAALRERKCTVPGDISLVGFDGIERWMPTPPFLTTLHQPFHRIGMQAVELLLERIQGGPAAPYRHTILDVHLAVHQSTGKIARP